MNDLLLSEKAKQCMNVHQYNDAIKFLRQIKNDSVALEMEFLVIEHEQKHLSEKTI